ncbi:hypothetical protein TWF281_003875 [Arthrobotrys megalospora]
MALMTSRKRARPCPELDDYKEEIMMRYYTGWPLKKIVQRFNDDYGLTATESQYRTRLYGPWACRKRVKTDEWVQIDKEITAREAVGKSETEVVLNRSTCVSQKAIERGRRRNVTFTARLFASKSATGALTRSDGFETTASSMTAIEVSTPLDLSGFVMDIQQLPLPNQPPPKIPYSILYRLPIVVSQAFLNAVLQRPKHHGMEVSSAKPHPSLALLKVILFRLSNKVFTEEQLGALLDTVDRLGYRGALKELISLKTVSTEAACYGLLEILYERCDEELILHIQETYPDTRSYDFMLSMGMRGFEILSIVPGPDSSTDIDQRARLSVYGAGQRLGSTKLATIKLIILHIQRLNLRPRSVTDARLLLLLCEECSRDLTPFFRLWDPSKVSVSDLESSGSDLYMPLLTASISGVDMLFNAGFKCGYAFGLLRATLEADLEAVQAFIKIFYPDWRSRGHNSLLSFAIDEKGNFQDNRLVKVLQDTSTLLHQNRRRGDTSDPFQCKAQLLLYIGTVRPTIMNVILDHIEQMVTYEEFMSILRRAVNQVKLNTGLSKEILNLKYSFSFLGDPSSRQILEMLQQSFNRGLDMSRTGIWANFQSSIWASAETCVNQIPLDPLIGDLLEFLLETGFSLESSLPDDLWLYPRLNVPGVGYIEPSGKQTLLHLSFRMDSCWFFILLLSRGASPSALQDSFQAPGQSGLTVSSGFWAAIQNLDDKAIIKGWDSRFRLAELDQSPEAAVRKVIAALERGETADAAKIALQAYVQFDSASRSTMFISALVASLRPASLRPASPTDTCQSIPETFLHDFIKAALQWAIIGNAVELVELLLGGVRMIKSPISSLDWGFLYSYTELASLESLKLLVAAGIGIREAYNHGARPLHYAIRGFNFNMAVFLLSEGADIYSYWLEPGYERSTAVEEAVRLTRVDIVSLFLEVHPDCLDHALEAAARWERTYIAKHIRSWKAKRAEGGDLESSTRSFDEFTRVEPELELLQE